MKFPPSDRRPRYLSTFEEKSKGFGGSGNKIRQGVNSGICLVQLHPVLLQARLRRKAVTGARKTVAVTQGLSIHWPRVK